MSKPIPQPQEKFLIGNLKEIEPDHPLESLQRLQKLYGDIFRLNIFGKNLIVVSSQEIANFMCDESKFDKKIASVTNEIRALTGDGLFTAHTAEPNWKLAHKILMPAFGPKAIRDMFPAMVDISSQLILRWERFAGEEIDVCDNFTRLTLDTIALCSFNYRFNSFYENTMHRFVGAMVNVLVESGRRAGRFALQNKLMVGDAAGDFFGAFDNWKENLFRLLRKDTDGQNVVSEEKLSIEIVNSSRNLGQISDVGTVIQNKILNEASEIGPEKRHLEIKLPEGQTYRTGDYLAVLPTNPTEIVCRILKRFNLSADTHIKISSATDTFFPTNHPVSAFDILSGYVELGQPITKKQLETAAGLCQNEEEKTKLINLTGDVYEKEVLEKRISILDILDLYPSCQLSFAQYLRMLPSLRIRQYSISSSPLWNTGAVTLTLDILNSPAFSGTGQYYGVASNYLANLKEGDRINCSVRASNATFHPPDDTKVPIVMIAAGTGIAPFHGFIQERAAQLVCGRDIGPTILYYGCRTEKDFLYSAELEKWSKLGAVQVKSVFSRAGNSDKKYVQHLLWEDRKEIAQLYRDGAHFYVCGSAKNLGASVKACFIKIISDLKECNEEEATKMLEQVSRNRYSVDVFLLSLYLQDTFYFYCEFCNKTTYIDYCTNKNKTSK